MLPDWLDRGKTARWEGRRDDAKRHFERGLAETVDPQLRAAALTGLGRLERDGGSLDEAHQLYTQAAALYRGAGDLQKLAHTVRHVADIDRHRKRFAESEAEYREALALYRSDPQTPELDLANMLNGFAKLLAATGDLKEARAHTQEARDLYSSEHRRNGNLQAGIDECDARLRELSRA